MSRGANLEEVDKEGKTPLMIACSLGRIDNAKFIVESLRSLGNEAAVSKMGVGGVDRPQKNSWRAMHLAVVEGRLEVVRYLLEVGAQPESQLNTSYDKMTPLMLAAANGDLVNAISDRILTNCWLISEFFAHSYLQFASSLPLFFLLVFSTQLVD